MYTEIKNYVQSCDKCQKNKINRKLKPGYCELLEVEKPFSRIEIDIAGPFETTPRGNKYVIAAIDCFTKYVELKAIPAQDQYNVAKFVLDDIICRHSPPLIIQSDLGGAFISESLQAIESVYPPTIHKYSSGYNPEVNGQVERNNASIKEYLRTSLESETDWDLLIPSCRLSLNTRINTTTKRTPFEMLYNRQPYSFKDLELGVRSKSKENPLLFNESTKLKYEKEKEKIRKRIKDKQIRTAIKYNENHRQPIYLIGDLVMIKNRHLNPNQRTALQKKFEGPYIVIMRCHKNVYLIQDVYNPDITRKVNLRLMESYYNRDYRFLVDNPLPMKYLADIDKIQTEYDAEGEESTDSETELYFEEKLQSYPDSDESIVVLPSNHVSEVEPFSDKETFENQVQSQSVSPDIFTRAGRKVKIPNKYKDFILN